MAIENYISQSAPFGEAIPAGNPHAVSSSLPTQHDVWRLFRDHNPTAWAGLETTYPRFGEHPFVRQALTYRPTEKGRVTVALSSPEAAEQLVRIVPDEHLVEPEIEVDETLAFLSFTPGSAEARDILTVAKKVTGGVPSSRRAEDFLVAKGSSALEGRVYVEPTRDMADETTVAHDLRRVYFPSQPEVFLANSGMSAVSATVNAVYEIRNRDYTEGETGRDTWVLLGNLYRDSEDLFTNLGIRRRSISNVADVERLREVMGASGDRIAGIITEAPTNPLLEIPDLEQIKEIAGEIPLVVDVSSAGSLLADALPYADVVVESLTKFASGHGDVMMGAVIVNNESEYSAELNEHLPKIIEPPYYRDVKRLAYELEGWQDRAITTGKNVVRLAEFFEGHEKIKNVHWTGSEKSRADYDDLARYAGINAGLLTIEIKRSLRPAYDALDLSKGPSFGTQFTLNTDFVGIVYAQEIRDPFSRGMLERRTGLTPRMLRISVGTEDPDRLIDRYDAALKG